MFPILIKLGPLTIRTYGFFVAVGLFVALQYILYKSKKEGIPEDAMFDLTLYSIVGGLIGARLTYVAFNFNLYSKNLWDILKIWEGGLVFYGGFIIGTISGLLYIFYHKELKIWTIADILAPAISIGHFFGRIGCFFAGCCYGKPTDLPWAVVFKNPQCLAPINVPIHPVQLYEAFLNLVIFIILVAYDRKKHPTGLVFALYLFLYALVRFMLEFLRGDDRGGFFIGLSPSQLLAIIAIITSVIIFYFRKESYE